MLSEFWFPSQGAGQIHCCQWTPDGEIRGVVQIVHGIAEHVARYTDFAAFLNSRGFLVVAEDHMGHGRSADSGTQGYFNGGWFAAVSDTVTLMKKTMEAYPGVPYILFGHSMGSFMARTILCMYPTIGLTAAVICGTGWQSSGILPAGIGICEAVCRRRGEKEPSQALQNIVFGGYNKRVEHVRTDVDWLSRDKEVVDAYIADPRCGFVPSAGLLRDMMIGIRYVQNEENLKRMQSDLPVLFVAGSADPVGNYGKGVHHAAEAFRKTGMRNVTERLFPLCRHEILNEINKEEVYAFCADWMEQQF